jgi:hypothetical protein
MTDRLFTSTLTIAVVAAMGTLLFLVVSGGRAGAVGGGAPQAKPVGLAVAAPAPIHRFPHRPVPSVDRRPVNGPSYAFARLRPGASVALRAVPGGRVLTRVGPKSEFGGALVLGIVGRDGDWLAVLSPSLPNGRHAWVRDDRSRLDLWWTKYSLRIDLSRRTLDARYGDRSIGRFLVTVGTAGSDTPVGRFAITDAVTYDDNPYYGCCVAVLSAHQPNLPQGWIGGDRLAIHGTPAPVGYAGSAGCVRATDHTMRFIFARVPLGTPVFILP